MTDPTNEARALLIKNLLNKAEANGATEAERESYNAKAAQLMLKWGIEEAMIKDADRLEVERVVAVTFQTDAPKSYSYEVTIIGIEVAEAFNCRGLLQKMGDGRVNLTVVGFESDTARVKQMFTSLARQAKMTMATAYSHIDWLPWDTGTDKYNWKRSFLRGFAAGVAAQFRELRKATIAAAEAATPGTELVLVTRVAKVDSYIEDQMKVGKARSRRSTIDSHGATAGLLAGMKADIGGTQVTS